MINVVNSSLVTLVNFFYVFSITSIMIEFVVHVACNYGKGKWIKVNSRPLYSGFGCKKFLSAIWACRLMKRTDFSYERFQWKPQGCDLPEFSGSKFLQRHV